ncbi:MAG: hypothetical protein HY800_01880, partial [Ignavibacteriales bacterium]|nr:hypothetical protein [Ignavibacteriales bacterium]
MVTLRRFLDSLSKLVGACKSDQFTEIDFQKLETVLQCSIKNRQLFMEALSHRSYIQMSRKVTNVSNERLEFLGDSVLNLVVGDYLYRYRPIAEEGELTRLRSR